jgi:hypothetical protein
MQNRPLHVYLLICRLPTAVDLLFRVTPAMSLSAGMVAGLVEGSVCVVPMTTLQVKFCHDLSCEAPRYRGLHHGVRTIVSEEGWRGIYRVCMIGERPFVWGSGIRQRPVAPHLRRVLAQQC